MSLLGASSMPDIVMSSVDWLPMAGSAASAGVTRLSKHDVLRHLPAVVQELLDGKDASLVVEEQGRRWVKRSALVSPLLERLREEGVQVDPLAKRDRTRLTATLDAMQRKARDSQLLMLKVGSQVYAALPP